MIRDGLKGARCNPASKFVEILGDYSAHTEIRALKVLTICVFNARRTPWPNSTNEDFTVVTELQRSWTLSIGKETGPVFRGHYHGRVSHGHNALPSGEKF
jgi:hypothetical protein